METEKDSLLERIRALEEKVERGITVCETSGTGTAERPPQFLRGEERELQESEPAPPVRMAAPEDLRLIRERWKKIVNRTAPPLKIYLQGAVPKYDGGTGDSRLFVELSDRTACMYVNRTEKIEELKTAIQAEIGKTAEVEIVQADGGSRSLAEIPVDELLQKEVRMPVETEDGPESEFE